MKPESLQHPKVGTLSDRAFRLWIGLITQADDEGRLRWHADQFSRILVFGYQDEVTTAMVSKALLEIVEAGLAYLYVVDSKEYVELHDWKEHQKVDHPVPSLIPASPRESSRAFENRLEGSGSGSGSGSEEPLSGSARQDASKPGNTETHQVLEAEAPADPPRPVHLKVVPDNTTAREVLDYLNRRTGRAYEPVEANLKLIRARLAEPGRTVKQMLSVVDAKVAEWLKDPEMNGYLRPETLFGAKKFAQYVGALSQGKAEPTQETPEEAYVRKQWTLMGEEMTIEQATAKLAEMAKAEGTHVG